MYRLIRILTRAIKVLSLVAVTLCGAVAAPAQTNNSIFPLFPGTVSTIPTNADVNPYGIVFLPKSLQSGLPLQPGDVLVSNFNNNQNLQGLGTTIIRVRRGAGVSTFYTAPVQQSGLSAALGVLSNGWVITGNLPTADGTPNTVQPGSLSVLDSSGNFLANIGNVPANVDGPWGMFVQDLGRGGTGLAHVYVSNVLSGVISRFDIKYSPQAASATVVVLATGFNHRLDPAALVLGPSGLAYDADHDALLVASSTDNAIYQIPNASTATQPQTAILLFQDPTHLHGPLDIAFLPNGHLLVANSDGSNADPNQPSEVVEFTAKGKFLGQMSVDPNNGGAFGLAINNVAGGVFRMATVDDNQNSLTVVTDILQ